MKITVISDTHGEHEKLGVLSGEVLVHCGDMFNMFNQSNEDFDRMDEWFGKQDFDLVLCIGGNHDFELEKRSCYVDNPFRNAVYLEGAKYEFAGVNFFGAPWVPDLYGQAYFVKDSDLPSKWAAVPTDVDVLITHTPPGGILDVSSRGLELGCQHLLSAIEKTKPTIHCFGHVHASSGAVRKNETMFINASMVNSQYKLAREPWEFEI